MNASEALEPIRAFCAGLPGVSERLSHGSPAFFAGRCFATVTDRHHGVPWVALWCAADPAFQIAMVAAHPEVYFVPPYVGRRGWLGVRLGRGLAAEALENHLLEAYRRVAGARLLASLEARGVA